MLNRSPILDIAVIGSGIAGMSAAWLLSQKHNVTVYEREDRLGGHSNTVEAPTVTSTVPVDTGFIVYNERSYPNLTALFKYLDVPTKDSEMSFAVSLNDGGMEYSGTDINGMFGQRRNILRPRFWAMLKDVRRFYRDAPSFLVDDKTGNWSLGQYLEFHGYSKPFIEDHLLPMGAAIWSASAADMLDFPAAAFIRFFESHGLLEIVNRPVWRTVDGGSREYVKRLTQGYRDRVLLSTPATSVHRQDGAVFIESDDDSCRRFDHVVIASHADQALSLLSDANTLERRWLGAIRYSQNRAVLHSDRRLMPKRKRVWSSWNYLQSKQNDGDKSLCVTYWMNRLQGIDPTHPFFVTLNPHIEPDSKSIIGEFSYEHPVFDRAALDAQQHLWPLQGRRNTWFCGSYFGYGFHEDALQSGLAVAEAVGGVRRPWTVPGESDRIALPQSLPAAA
jgi:predicted NAD/FAD-binding protein